MIYSLIEGTVFLILLVAHGIHNWPKYYHIASFVEFSIAFALLVVISLLLYRLATKKITLQ